MNKIVKVAVTISAVWIALMYVVCSILIAPILIPLTVIVAYAMGRNMDGVKELLTDVYVNCMLYAIKLEIRKEIYI